MDEDIIKELNEVFDHYSRVWSPAHSAEMVHSYAVLKAAKMVNETKSPEAADAAG